MHALLGEGMTDPLSKPSIAAGYQRYRSLEFHDHSPLSARETTRRNRESVTVEVSGGKVRWRRAITPFAMC
jgi:hypothetical protein